MVSKPLAMDWVTANCGNYRVDDQRADVSDCGRQRTRDDGEDGETDCQFATGGPDQFHGASAIREYAAKALREVGSRSCGTTMWTQWTKPEGKVAVLG